MKFTMKLLGLIFGLLLLVNAANAESSREQFRQMVEQLQANPTDNALRENIIRLALKLKPAPAVPEEARRHFVKAVTLQKEAKSPEDYDLPIQEYRQALLLAPWWSDAYFDLASALELKQQYAEAIQNLKLSILASPEGPDARTAQDKVYALEAKSDVQNKVLEKERSVAAEKAKRKEWAETIVQQLKQRYSDHVFLLHMCMAGNRLPICSDEEANGTHWRTAQNASFRFSFETWGDNSNIIMKITGKAGFCGTPRDASLENVKWTLGEDCKESPDDSSLVLNMGGTWNDKIAISAKWQQTSTSWPCCIRETYELER